MVRTLFILIALLLILAPARAVAQEARCTELGSNCICSEPMNTSTFTLPVSDWTIGFPDGGTRKCAYLGIAGVAGEIPPASRNQIFMSNNATVLNALTGTGNPTRVISGVEGQTGAWQMGHSDIPSSNQARVALRVYRYYSPTFEFSNTGTACLNSGKEFQGAMYGGPTGIGGYITEGNPGTGWAITSFGGFSPLPLCCGIAPGYSPSDVPTITYNIRRGRWFRMEYIVTNTAASGFRIEMYAADVTRGIARLYNGAEFTITNTAVTCGEAPYPAGCNGDSGGGGWTSAMANNLTPPVAMRAVNVFGFRNGTCAGFAAYSYMMGATWPTNAGQRIGAASEIEGGGPPPTPPSAPTNLTVTPTSTAIAALIFVAGLAALALGRRRR